MINKQRKIHVIGGGQGYCNWMEGTEFVDSVRSADLVVLTGGQDINPSLYSKPVHPRTYFTEARDTQEVRAVAEAQAYDKPIIGICRGAQLLCALAGGELIQDQDDPRPFHMLHTVDGKQVTMTSLHHQAMFPWKLKADAYKVIGWTKENSSYHDGCYKGIEMLYEVAPCQMREVEICYFTYLRGLGIQGHPEMMYSKSGFNKPVAESIAYCRALLDKLITDTI